MNKDMFDTLLAYIDDRIDEKIEEAFGRDSLIEAQYTRQSREMLEYQAGLRDEPPDWNR